jgi:hypothetical protein
MERALLVRAAGPSPRRRDYAIDAAQGPARRAEWTGMPPDGGGGDAGQPVVAIGRPASRKVFTGSRAATRTNVRKKNTTFCQNK